MARWDVFISYSWQDASVVDHYCRELQNERFRIWLDRSRTARVPAILPLKLSHGLAESSILVLFLSWNAVKSDWVRQEVDAFYKKPCGFWDDGAQPIILAVRFPKTDFEFDNLVRPPWRTCPEKPMELYAIESADHDTGAVEVVDFVRKTVAVLREETHVDLGTCDRVTVATRFWNWALPRNLDHWSADEIPNVLSVFDHFEAMSDWDLSDLDQDVERAIREVIEIAPEGTTLAVLFAEAIVSTYGSVYASVDEREEIRFGLRGLPRVLSSGCPVDLLCNAAVDQNIGPGIVGAYRMIRPMICNVQSRDALDLTALLALGYCLDRWEATGVHLAEVQAVLLTAPSHKRKRLTYDEIYSQACMVSEYLLEIAQEEEDVPDEEFELESQWETLREQAPSVGLDLPASPYEFARQRDSARTQHKKWWQWWR